MSKKHGKNGHGAMSEPLECVICGDVFDGHMADGTEVIRNKSGDVIGTCCPECAGLCARCRVTRLRAHVEALRAEAEDKEYLAARLEDTQAHVDANEAFAHSPGDAL
jgi:hypothetical protein